MADKPDSKGDAPIKDEITEFIWILLAIFLAFYFLSLLVSAVSSNKLLSLGWNAFTPQGLLISKTRPISSLINPINSRFVVTSKEAPLYSSPNGKQIALKKLGDEGIIVGGPVTISGEKYWRVNFEDGSSGWVLEGDIASLPQAETPLKDIPTLIATQVELTKDSPVFSLPGEAQITTKSAGSLASIIEGPIIKDEVKYWHLRFDDGTVGWVSEENLNSLKTERQPMREATDQIGGKVAVSNGPLDVFSEPGGRKVGEVLVGANGTVLEGPRESGGARYWRVEFSDGTVGWVNEGSLDYLRITKTPLSQMPSLLGGKVKANRNSTQVYDRPGGSVIMTKSKGAVGEILEGPLVQDDRNYWHIKFEDGTDGWVSEDDLNYLENIEPNALEKTISFFVNSVKYVRFLIILICLALVGFVVYLYKMLSSLRSFERQALYPEGISENIEEQRIVNPSWERVLDYTESLSESDWKLAIVEADIMLGELLEKLSVPGDTIGDKLKVIEKSDFTTLDKAWDAHKVRNQIAHESGFRLSQRETRRVVDLYRSIFDEFEMI